MEYKKRQRFYSLSRMKNKISRKTPLTVTKKSHKNIKWIVLAVLILSIIVYGTSLAVSLKDIIRPNKGKAAEGLQGELQLSSLKGEGQGRVNILLLGTGDAGHDGENLTDTIIVASIDPKTNDAVMLGIPRDLYVKMPGAGYERINSVAYYAEQNQEGSGEEALKQVVSGVIGQPIHYYVKANFTGLKSVVDKLGNIDIYSSEDIYDPEYPCDNNQYLSCGFKLDKGYYKMDGAFALKYARCRKGSCGNDYGRSKRQQDVLVAIRDKAISLGNLLNPSKTSDLLSVAGQNIRTDLNLEEMRKLVSVARKVDSKSVVSRVLDTENQGLVTDKMINSASVVVPSEGLGKYDSIHSFVSGLFIDGYIKTENATIKIQNKGTSDASVYALSSMLKSMGYNVVGVEQSKNDVIEQSLILDTSGDSNNYTVKYLQNRLGVEKVEKSNRNSNNKSDIVIMLGKDYEFKNRS